MEQLNTEQKQSEPNCTGRARKKAERRDFIKERKESKKLTTKMERAEKEALLDRIEFGEVVHAPPSFKNLPRGTQKNSGKKMNLILMEKLKDCLF